MRLCRQREAAMTPSGFCPMLPRSSGDFIGFRFAAQEIFFLLLFELLVRPLRVVAFHLGKFFRSKAGQMTDEVNQPPTVALGGAMPGKSRHSREANAVFDDPIKLAIAQALGTG